MFVQILIYVYLGICAGMILFNIVTALLSRRREHRSFCDGIRLELTVSRELDRLAETGAVSERHLRFMERRLRRVNGMAAFDAALECLCVRRPELTRSYLTALNAALPRAGSSNRQAPHFFKPLARNENFLWEGLREGCLFFKKRHPSLIRVPLHGAGKL